MLSHQSARASQMANNRGRKAGPPPAVKKVLSMFGSGREEDRLTGYLSLLKIGPKLLKFVPGQRARDLRAWLTVYAYWNQGGADNVVAMCRFIIEEFFELNTGQQGAATTNIPLAALRETPPTGCVHPAYGRGTRVFTTPQQYMQWYKVEGPLRSTNAPIVAVLLYRKHVITQQPYVLELISCLEEQGVLPVPIFINGVEGHTIVRDVVTTTHEQQLIATSGMLAHCTQHKTNVDVASFSHQATSTTPRCNEMQCEWMPSSIPSASRWWAVPLAPWRGDGRQRLHVQSCK